jgi:hypothetical protein
LEDKSQPKNEEAEELLFREMMEICLWGNATDLSLLTSLTYEDIQKLQGSEARKKSEKNILANDLGAAYETLMKAKAAKQERRVDIVLDNAGFELYVDLILAGYLLSSGLATTVVLHPKSIPWFVSDVVPVDFAMLLSALADPQAYYSNPSEDEQHAGKTPTPLSQKEVDELTFLFEQWSGFHQEGQLVLRPNRFWTEGGSYWRLPKTQPALFEDLKTSELVIFKGDLNYRKLSADVSTTKHSKQSTPRFGHWLIHNSACGIPRLPSSKPSVLLVQAQVSTYSPCAPVKQTSSSAFNLGWTRSCDRWRVEVEILGLASGLGVVNGRLFRSQPVGDLKSHAFIIDIELDLSHVGRSYYRII